MDYRNQLVLTGALNDVGSSIRENVDVSYRAGVELTGSFKLTKKLEWTLNTTLSQNKIDNFTEIVTKIDENWDPIATVEFSYENRDISYSPSIIAGSLMSYKPAKGLEFSLQTKYVGMQYLDNTSNEERSLPAYIVSDFIASYSTSFLSLKHVQFNLLVNNIFNEMYSNNAYAYTSLTIDDERSSGVGYYPQAGTNLLAGVTVKF